MVDIAIQVGISLAAMGIEKLDTLANGKSERRKRDDTKAQVTHNISNQAALLLQQAHQVYLEQQTQVQQTIDELEQDFANTLQKWRTKAQDVELFFTKALDSLESEHKEMLLGWQQLAAALKTPKAFQATKKPIDWPQALKLNPLHLALIHILSGAAVDEKIVANLIAQQDIQYLNRDYGINPAEVLLSRSKFLPPVLQALGDLLHQRMLIDAHRAVIAGDLDTLDNLLALDGKRLVNAATPSGHTLLMSAAKSGRTACLATLLAQPNIKTTAIDKQKQSAFDYALDAGNKLAIARLAKCSKLTLLEKLIIARSQRNLKRHAATLSAFSIREFQLAVLFNNADLIETMVAKTPLETDQQQELLSFATQLGRAAVVERLLKLYPQGPLKDNSQQGGLVLQHALREAVKSNDPQKLKAFLMMLPMAQPLLAKACFDGLTPLGYAKAHNKSKVEPVLREALGKYFASNQRLKSWLKQSLDEAKESLSTAIEAKSLNVNSKGELNVATSGFYQDLDEALAEDRPDLRPNRNALTFDSAGITTDIHSQHAYETFYQHLPAADKLTLLLAEKLGLVQLEVGFGSYALNPWYQTQNCFGAISATGITTVELKLFVTDLAQGLTRQPMATTTYYTKRPSSELTPYMAMDGFGIMTQPEYWTMHKLERRDGLERLLKRLRAELAQPEHLSKVAELLHAKDAVWVDPKAEISDENVKALQAKLSSALSQDEVKGALQWRKRQAGHFLQDVDSAITENEPRIAQLERAVKDLKLDLDDVADETPPADLDDLALFAIFEQMLATESEYSVDAYCKTLEGLAADTQGVPEDTPVSVPAEPASKTVPDLLDLSHKQAQRQCGGRAKSLGGCLQSLQRQGQLVTFVEGMTHTLARTEADFYSRTEALAFVMQAALKAQRPIATTMHTKHTQFMPLAQKALAGAMVAQSASVIDERVNLEVRALDDQYLELKKGMISEKAQALEEIANIKVELKSEYYESLETLKAQEAAVERCFQSNCQAIEREKAERIAKAHAEINRNYKQKMRGFRPQVQMSVDLGAFAKPQIARAYNPFTRVDEMASRDFDRNYSPERLTSPVVMRNGGSGLDVRPERLLRGGQSASVGEDAVQEKENRLVLGELLRQDGPLYRMSVTDGEHTSQPEWGMEHSVHAAKGVGEGVALNTTLYNLSKLKYVGRAVRWAGAVGLLSTFAEVSHQARKFESADLTRMDEYADWANNPLISKEKMDEIYAESVSSHEVAQLELGSGNGLKSWALEHPEMLGLGVGSLFGVTGGGSYGSWKGNSYWNVFKNRSRKKLSGAREFSASEYMRAEKLAEKVYEEIRLNKFDVELIAKNTGMKEFKIRRIKEHLFIKEHRLRYNTARFDADPLVAESWKRLENGKFSLDDIHLLNHELFESKFEGIFKVDYFTSHNAANKAGHISPLEALKPEKIKEIYSGFLHRFR